MEVKNVKIFQKKKKIKKTGIFFQNEKKWDVNVLRAKNPNLVGQCTLLFGKNNDIVRFKKKLLLVQISSKI